MLMWVRAAAGGEATEAAEAATLEISGPGVFTDVVSLFLAPHAAAALESSYPAALLPRVAWGANPDGYDGVLPSDAGVLLQHAFASSWRPAVRCRAPLWAAAPERGAPRAAPRAAAPAHSRYAVQGAPPPRLAGSVAAAGARRAAAAAPWLYVPRLTGILVSRDFWTWTKREHFARCAARLARPAALSADERAVLYEPAAVTVPGSPGFGMLVHHRGYAAGLAPDGRDESYEVRVERWGGGGQALSVWREDGGWR